MRDIYTHTEADAGRYEAAHAYPDDDRPTLADVYEDPTDAARTRERNRRAAAEAAAARAAGDQTPSRLARLNTGFFVHPLWVAGMSGRLEAVRETWTPSPDGRFVQYGTVYRLHLLDGDPAAAAEALTTGPLKSPHPEAYHRDAIVRDGVVWLLVHGQALNWVVFG